MIDGVELYHIVLQALTRAASSLAHEVISSGSSSGAHCAVSSHAARLFDAALEDPAVIDAVNCADDPTMASIAEAAVAYGVRYCESRKRERELEANKSARIGGKQLAADPHVFLDAYAAEADEIATSAVALLDAVSRAKSASAATASSAHPAAMATAPLPPQPHETRGGGGANRSQPPPIAPIAPPTASRPDTSSSLRTANMFSGASMSTIEANSSVEGVTPTSAPLQALRAYDELPVRTVAAELPAPSATPVMPAAMPANRVDPTRGGGRVTVEEEEFSDRDFTFYGSSSATRVAAQPLADDVFVSPSTAAGASPPRRLQQDEERTPHHGDCPIARKLLHRDPADVGTASPPRDFDFSRLRRLAEPVSAPATAPGTRPLVVPQLGREAPSAPGEVRGETPKADYAQSTALASENEANGVAGAGRRVQLPAVSSAEQKAAADKQYKLRLMRRAVTAWVGRTHRAMSQREYLTHVTWPRRAEFLTLRRVFHKMRAIVAARRQADMFRVRSLFCGRWRRAHSRAVAVREFQTNVVPVIIAKSVLKQWHCAMRAARLSAAQNAHLQRQSFALWARRAQVAPHERSAAAHYESRLTARCFRTWLVRRALRRDTQALEIDARRKLFLARLFAKWKRAAAASHQRRDAVALYGKSVAAAALRQWRAALIRRRLSNVVQGVAAGATTRRLFVHWKVAAARKAHEREDAVVRFQRSREAQLRSGAFKHWQLLLRRRDLESAFALRRMHRLLTEWALRAAAARHRELMLVGRQPLQSLKFRSLTALAAPQSA